MAIAALQNEALRLAALPITVEQYHVLGESGALGARTELLEGVIIAKMTKTPRHTLIVMRLQDALREMCMPGCCIFPEQPLTLTDSEPEPDLAVVVGSLEDYADAHPSTALLVIEVAVSSLELDRRKAGIYARAGIPEYWLFDAEANQVEVYSNPTRDAYANRRIAAAGESLPVPFAPEHAVDLKSILR